MGTDESATIDLLSRDLAYMTAEAGPLGGRVIKTTGDGLLLQFGSAGQAVEFAMKVQTAFGRAAEAKPAGECLQHRIGIHLGDVILSGDDVLGDGVNIAARVLAEAEPGGICFSQTVYDVVKNRLGIKATYLGPRELKNIRDEVPLYQILVAAATKQRDSEPILAPLPAQRGLSHSAARKLVYALGFVVIVVAVALVYFKTRHTNQPVPAESAPAQSVPAVFVAGTVNPIPPDAALAVAEAAIKKKFAAGYASSSSSDRLALVRTLLAEGKVTSDTAERFVCYREAQKVAAENGNLNLALTAISTAEKDYRIDADTLRASAFETVAAQVYETNACVELVRRGLYMLDGMMLVNDVLVNVENSAPARRMVTVLEIPVGRSQQPELAIKLKRWSNLVTYAERVHTARETLKVSPDDPISNTIVAQYLMFTRKDWLAALPMLVKGNRPLARDAALKELAGATDKQGRMAIADAWRKAAERYDANEKAAILAHADAIAGDN
jgi:hypothetical protein